MPAMSLTDVRSTSRSTPAATGTVELAASPLVDLSMLAPRRVGDAFVVETSFSEGFARIDLDYLAGS
jgi:hypothetical protein